MPGVNECFSTGQAVTGEWPPKADLMSLTILVVVPVAASGRASLNNPPVKAEACTQGKGLLSEPISTLMSCVHRKASHVLMKRLKKSLTQNQHQQQHQSVLTVLNPCPCPGNRRVPLWCLVLVSKEELCFKMNSSIAPSFLCSAELWRKTLFFQ